VPHPSFSPRRPIYVDPEGNKLKQWVIDNGGSIHESLVVAMNAPSGSRGVVAMDDITEAGAKLVDVPEVSDAAAGGEGRTHVGVPSTAESTPTRAVWGRPTRPPPDAVPAVAVPHKRPGGVGQVQEDPEEVQGSGGEPPQLPPAGPGAVDRG